MPAHTNNGPAKATFSNQPQNNIPSDFGKHGYKTENGSIIHVKAPVCDWLTLIAPIRISDVFHSATSQGEDPSEYLAHVVKAARVSLGQTIKKGANQESAFKSKTPTPGYSAGHKRLGTDAASTGFFVANKLNKKQTGYNIRINLNPARLKSTGLAKVDDIFTELFLEEFSFNTFIGRAKYTRVDVAVDVLNLGVGDLIFSEHEKSKWSGYYDPSFAVETISRLKRTNKGKWRPEIRVYNKGKEFEDKGKAALYGALPHTRIEASKQTQRYLRDLLSLPNPFEKVAFGYLPELAHKMPCGFSNFAHASMRVGIERALDDVPPNLRENFATAIKSAPAFFWNPDTIWGSWTDGLAQIGLLTWIEKAKAAAND